MTTLERYRKIVDSYKPLPVRGLPVGGREFEEWLRHYIMQMAVYGYERGLRGDALREHVQAERIFAVKKHNQYWEPVKKVWFFAHAQLNIDVMREWVNTIVTDIEENR